MNQTVFQADQIEDLKNEIQRFEPKDIFVVRANKSFHFSGAEKFLNKLICCDNYTSFYSFDPNPQVKDLEKGLELYKKNHYKLIIAIGGGSVIDMAKLISLFAHQNAFFKKLILAKSNFVEKKTPLIAIPTTAGTGAEATHFAVLYMNGIKYSVAHPLILPDYTFLSPEFLVSVSPYLTACSGIDAFSQAIESFWSINSTHESREFSKKAIRIIWENLYSAVNEKNNESRSKLLEASFLSGRAINISKTTGPHALSYGFTINYGLPHGHAVALFLPIFMQLTININSYNCNDIRGVRWIKGIIGELAELLETNVEKLPVRIFDFIISIGLIIDFKKLNISKPMFDKAISGFNEERLKNNPIKINSDFIENIFFSEFNRSKD
ncbi:MAG: phosphonoacetaldehyde reductase [Salinivirgaceae bacterium]